MNKANEDQIKRKVVKQEQERAEELKVIEYMKQKAVSLTYYVYYISAADFFT